MLRIGVDTGGTFTDFVVVEEGQVRSFKLPSTPRHPEKAVLEGLVRILNGRGDFLLQHGSTVATNTLLERKGARTLLVTNEGFEDVLEIGRQNRPRLYHLSSSRSKPLVSRRLRLGIKERRDCDGNAVVALENKSLAWLRNKVKQLAPEAIAVVLLYSHLNPESELLIAEALDFAQVPVTLSHQVLPEFREYERSAAAVTNAYLTVSMGQYLSSLGADGLLQEGKLSVMQSNGGTVPAAIAQRQPLKALLSGPAGGVSGAWELLGEAGYQRMISFDMGGTSTDICLCDHGIPLTTEGWVGGQPVPVEMIDIHSVGAGGSSIVRLGGGDLLRVGPESVGLDPGPICFGKGDDITVMDANLALGRLEPEQFLAGEMKLNPERVGPALEALAAQVSRSAGKTNTPLEVAEGIIEIVNSKVGLAIQKLSLRGGHDIRDFSLVSFGGAGGLHACDVARSLGMPRVVVPPSPGVFSALGILRANLVKDASQTVMLDSRDVDLKAKLEAALEPLEGGLRREIGESGPDGIEMECVRSLDLRYPGQSHQLNVPLGSDFEERFHRLHNQRYGYSNPTLPLELVNVRVRGTGRWPSLPSPKLPLSSEESAIGAVVGEKEVFWGGRWISTRCYLRERLRPGNQVAGPALVLEYSSTIFIPADFRGQIDEWNNIVIEPLGV